MGVPIVTVRPASAVSSRHTRTATAATAAFTPMDTAAGVEAELCHVAFMLNVQPVTAKTTRLNSQTGKRLKRDGEERKNIKNTAAKYLQNDCKKNV